ncbi:hypothetical protein WH52_02920 [Tenacibaculum holothuriorum]|uniref:Adhesin domain-containing protein n=2 Tax=Tenacibaculum holothuriorum TaxID=1635173 RepID=A0A1Y2PFR4_9FLAO|nr:hypothetical protein WH52_02920 [Tenacibaculum holothuriorum]
MKKIVTLLLFFITITIVSQQKVLKELTLTASDKLIEIETLGLDDVVIETSKNNTLQVLLIDENAIPLNVDVKKVNNTIQLSFKKIEGAFQKEIFRKYITKRLERARVLLKIPINKDLVVYGRTIGVKSKSYKGNLEVYIEKGNVYLGKIYNETSVKLFLGNVFANVDKNVSLSLKTRKGKIMIDDKEIAKKPYKKTTKGAKKLTFDSVNANIFITTK